MEVIQSIRYDKRTGEFYIISRDTVSGETSVACANHLTEKELIFAKSCTNFCDDKYAAHWTP